MSASYRPRMSKMALGANKKGRPSEATALWAAQLGEDGFQVKHCELHCAACDYSPLTPRTPSG